MHIFGEHWRNHPEQIESGWRKRVGAEDVVLVTGDISWARTLKKALPDLEWLHRLPGRKKLLVPGNHDAWWPKPGHDPAQIPNSLTLLDGTALRCGEDVFCGAGGWLAPEDPYFEPLDEGAYRRALTALEQALEAGAALARGGGFHLLIHFPPWTSSGQPNAFDRLLRRYAVCSVTFGHYHLEHEWARAPRGRIDGIHYTLAAADYVEFTPVEIPGSVAAAGQSGHNHPGYQSESPG